MSINDVAHQLEAGPTMMDIRDEGTVLEQLMSVSPALAAAEFESLEQILERIVTSRTQSIFQFDRDDPELVKLHARFAAWLRDVAALSHVQVRMTYVEDVVRTLTTTANDAFGQLEDSPRR
jgi:hypothetical protein